MAFNDCCHRGESQGEGVVFLKPWVGSSFVGGDEDSQA